MRGALLLIVVAACSSKKAAEPRAEETAPASPPAAVEAPAPAPEPTAGAAPAPDRQHAVDEARAQGVLGPTYEGSAFEPIEAAPKPDAVADRKSGTGAAPAAGARVKGSVSIDRIAVIAGDKQLADAILRRLARIEACYDKALAANPQIAGDITVTLEAAKVSIDRSTLSDAPLESCVADALGKPPLPRTGKASFKLVFQRE